MTRCRDAELGSGDAASVAGFGAPVGERVGEIVDQVVDFGRGGVVHWEGFLPQERVAELEDGADGHGGSSQFSVLSSQFSASSSSQLLGDFTTSVADGLCLRRSGQARPDGRMRLSLRDFVRSPRCGGVEQA